MEKATKVNEIRKNFQMKAHKSQMQKNKERKPSKSLKTNGNNPKYWHLLGKGTSLGKNN